MIVIQNIHQYAEKHHEFNNKFVKKSKYFGLVQYGRSPLVQYLTIQDFGFSDGGILIALINEEIVGRIFMGLKTIFLNKKEITVGYIYDIQVKKNDVTFISEFIEKVIDFLKQKYNIQMIQAAARGINMSVEKFKSFQQLKFEIFSYRSICVATINEGGDQYSNQLIQGRNISYQRLQEQQLVMKYIDQTYLDEDFYLGKKQTLKDLIYSENYIGCFIVESDDEIKDSKVMAGVCLYVDKRVNQNNLLKVFFLTRQFIENQYFTLGFQSFVTFFMLVGMLMIIKHTEIQFQYSIFGSIFLYFVFQYYYDKFTNWIKVQSQPMLRVFAPFYIGDEQFEDEVFSFLLTNLQRDEEIRNYLDLRINIDENNRFVKHFKNKNGFTHTKARPFFVYKNLDESLGPTIIKIEFSKQSFQDPREI